MARPLRSLSLIAATLAVLANAAAAEDTWTLETISSGQFVPNCSIALDLSGTPCVAYNSGAQPHFGRRDGGQWINQGLSTPPFPAPDGITSPALVFYVVPSLAFDPVSGEPRIAYQRRDEDHVWYAEHSGSGWSYQLLSQNGDAPQVAFDAQGKAHVAYRDYTIGPVYRTWDGVTWTSELIPEGYGVSSLRVDPSGRPHVTMYTTGPSADLLYAVRGPGGWAVETVDTMGSLGTASLALDVTGAPHIAYVAHPGQTLRYAERSGNGWATVPVSSLTTGSISLVMGPPEHLTPPQPFIAFHDQVAGDLRFARRDWGTWSSSVVETTGNVGEYCSMAIAPSSRPHIAYHDLTNARVRYATRPPLVTGVDHGPAVSGWGIDRLAPNPLRGPGAVDLTLRVARAGTVGMELLDLAGRIVARTERALGAGVQTVRWDPGAPSAGLYFVRVRFAPGEVAGARLAILR